MTDTQPTQTNVLAILSVVSGGVSLLTVCFCYGAPFNILAIVLGAVALSQIGSDPKQGGGRLAKAGIGLGLLSFLFVALVVVASVVFGVGFSILGAMADQM